MFQGSGGEIFRLRPKRRYNGPFSGCVSSFLSSFAPVRSGVPVWFGEPEQAPRLWHNCTSCQFCITARCAGFVRVRYSPLNGERLGGIGCPVVGVVVPEALTGLYGSFAQ